nr:CocE/NonD family hydrolase [Actinomycetota bacterium]
VVEYSGYDPSNPTKNMIETVNELGVDAAALCETITIICATPAQPSSVLAAANGYAVVAVNIRGTGCSGGAYDFFEPLQLLDGYDVIETVAAQDWVRGKVGMVGLSYPGISQLFVASTQPPNLAAIAPMSVYDDTALGVLAPGGLYNAGFALSWAENVLDDAVPFGQGWEKQVVEEGDTICVDNQKMRGQNIDAVAKARSSEFYEPNLADPVNIAKFADRIEVPVFMTGAWQDEQTGPRFVNLWDKLTNAPVRKFHAMNGAHADGLGPETLVEWKMFLDFYVARERQPIPGFLRTFGPSLLADTFGSTMEFPPDRLVDGDFDALRAEYESEPDITIYWDRGGDPANPGAVTSTGRTTLTSWGDRAVDPTRWFFSEDGLLDTDAPATGGGWSTWRANPERASRVTLPGDLQGQAFDALPEFQWVQDAAGEAAVFVSKPLTSDTVLLGGGSADLWVRSDATNVDLGITLSEVRPDGKETFIQVGLLRGDIRKPGPNATELDPAQTFLEADSADLVPGEWTEMRVPILPVGHVLRAGSRLRVSVHTPGGDQPRWAFIVDPDARPTVDIGHDAAHPSSIVLPVGRGIGGYSPNLPPCPGLRGQPCRNYVSYANDVKR